MDKATLNLIAIIGIGVIFLIIEIFTIFKIYISYKQRKNNVDFKLPKLEEEKEPELMPSKSYNKIPTINKKKYSKDKVISFNRPEERDLQDEFESQYKSGLKNIKIVNLPKL